MLISKIIYVVNRLTAPVEDKWTKAFDWITLGVIYAYIFGYLIYWQSTKS